MGGKILSRKHIAALKALDPCGMVDHVFILLERSYLILKIFSLLLQRQDLFGHTGVSLQQVKIFLFELADFCFELILSLSIILCS